MKQTETSVLTRFCRDSEFRDSICASPPDRFSDDFKAVVGRFRFQVEHLRSESSNDLKGSAIEYLLSRW